MDVLAETLELHSRAIAAGYRPEILFGAKALVVGAGALGQNLVLDLALGGVGHLFVVDLDHFENHNVTRSPFYPTPLEIETVGLSKARVVAHKALPVMTAPQPRMLYAIDPIQELGDLAIAWADVVFSAVDNAAARAYLAERCRMHRKPMIEAGFHGASLKLAVFGSDPAEPCYRCVNPQRTGAFSCEMYALEAEGSGVVPAVQNGAAVLAGLQAEQGITWLHDTCSLRGHTARLEIRTLAGQVSKIMINPECPGVHELSSSEPLEVSVVPNSTLDDLLDEVERLAGPTVLKLPDPLVLRIWCTNCLQLVDARVPEWQWMAAPRCEHCGGPFRRLPEDGHAPEPMTLLDTRLRANTGGLTCMQAGITPGTLLQAWTGPELEQPATFRMPGTIQEVAIELSPGSPPRAARI